METAAPGIQPRPKNAPMQRDMKDFLLNRHALKLCSPALKDCPKDCTNTSFRTAPAVAKESAQQDKVAKQMC